MSRHRETVRPTAGLVDSRGVELFIGARVRLARGKGTVEGRLSGWTRGDLVWVDYRNFSGKLVRAKRSPAALTIVLDERLFDPDVLP